MLPRTCSGGTAGPRTARPPRLVHVLDLPPLARFGGLLATGLLDVTGDPAALDSTGFWAVCADFEGRTVCARFRDVRPAPVPAPVPGAWRGPAPGTWTSSLDRAAYTAGVRRIRAHIVAGEVYQANLCRVLSAPLAPDADLDALTALLAAGNPAPYAGTIRLPGHGVEIATASPELFLRRTGTAVESGPIKGTGRTEADLLDKDHAENVMIVDLVRNDLGRVRPRQRERPRPLRRREAPGPRAPGLHGPRRTARGHRLARPAGRHVPARLGHRRAQGRRPADHRGPGDGAPRPYCGGIGWVDADRGTGELAVGIRTFWADRGAGLLRFGTGAGITWGSDPEREWRETELKASRLLAIASGTYDDECGGTA